MLTMRLRWRSDADAFVRKPLSLISMEYIRWATFLGSEGYRVRKR